MIQVFKCHFKVIISFLTNRKCDFFQFHKALIQVVEWHLKVIFCLLTNPNFVIGEFEKHVSSDRQALGTHFLPLDDLGEFEKAMFHLLACHFELIFGLLTIPKCDFVEVDKAFFQGPA